MLIVDHPVISRAPDRFLQLARHQRTIRVAITQGIADLVIKRRIRGSEEFEITTRQGFERQQLWGEHC
ncbi:MAG: hypothetical protein U1E29_11420 [Coriobacteriia bacterium]|nr:hypothetical protein [Coriobacteriia bacterium]